MPDERAYNGKILNVHLTQRQVRPETLPDQMYKDYLGGYGLGARLLFDRIRALPAFGVDELLAAIVQIPDDPASAQRTLRLLGELARSA